MCVFDSEQMSSPVPTLFTLTHIYCEGTTQLRTNSFTQLMFLVCSRLSQTSCLCFSSGMCQLQIQICDF